MRNVFVVKQSTSWKGESVTFIFGVYPTFQAAAEAIAPYKERGMYAYEIEEAEFHE